MGEAIVKGNSLSLLDRDVIPVLCYAHVCGADDLSGTHDLLDAVRTPSRYPRDGEYGRVKLLRDVEHTVEQPAVEVDVDAGGERLALLLRHHLGCYALDRPVKCQILLAAHFRSKSDHEFPEYLGTGVGFGVDGMAHPVHESGSIEGLSAEEFGYVLPYPVLVGRVLHIMFQVVHHADDLEVRTSVLGALQRQYGGDERGIGVRTGRRDDPRRERGIVASAVLHLDGECGVKGTGLHF